MAKHQSYSVEFKRQVVQNYLSGEVLHGLAKRHFRPLRVSTGLLGGPATHGALRRPLRFAWSAGLLWHRAPAGSGALLRRPRARPLRATSLFRLAGPYALDDRPATLRHVIAPTAANRCTDFVVASTPPRLQTNLRVSARVPGRFFCRSRRGVAERRAALAMTVLPVASDAASGAL
jgi:hypothetical protein